MPTIKTSIEISAPREIVFDLARSIVYWGMGLEDSIDANRSVEIVGPYKPLRSGFNYEKFGVQPHKPAFYEADDIE